jgi:hypothetical protein
MQYLYIYIFIYLFIYLFIYICILLPASYQNLQYLFQDMFLLTHYLSLIFLRAWQKFIAEKEREFNPTITFYTDYLVRNPNNNFRFEKI